MAEKRASVRKQAVRQAGELVNLLGHHPSIVLWCGHNEPLDLRGHDPITTTERSTSPWCIFSKAASTSPSPIRSETKDSSGKRP